MNGAAILAMGTIVCLTVSVVYYAVESRRHRIAATFLYRYNRELKQQIHELETDLAIWSDILDDPKAQWNNHPSRRHLRAVDGDA